MIRVRVAVDDDFEDIWTIFHCVVQTADTYPFPHDTDKKEAYALWMMQPNQPYVALLDSKTVGTYYIRPNQPGQGAHVANAGFMVNPEFQGRGVGRVMGSHAIDVARKAGFKSMQFNMVVSTNLRAVALWKNLGFKVAGTIPDAFNHPAQGFVNTYIMYRKL